jgi:hypothetical protein
VHEALLARFVRSFQQAIREEMASMRERLGPFVVPVVGGIALGADDDGRDARYRFELAGPSDKLAAGMECSLRVGTAEHLVSIVSLEGTSLILRAGRRVALGAGDGVLVAYPWFLYERLAARLGELRCDQHEVERALALFGKLPHARTTRPLVLDHGALNDSQQRAVSLCSDSSLAFVWGPPGTGKTRTLAHVVEELLAQGKRLLLLSTTHAAVDQALSQLATRPGIARAIARGEVLRFGRTESETHGASVHEVVERLCTTHRAAIERARERLRAIEAPTRKLATLRTRLAESTPAAQTSLFDRASEPSLRAPELFDAFGARHAARIAAQPAPVQAEIVARRADRLARLRELLLTRIAAHNREFAAREARLWTDARAVLTTLTAAYFSPPLEGQRFDIVIVEEASMAVLPSVFYAACLAREKTLMVGDPRQLPPIVQSSSPYVRQAMGRSIFEVTVPEPETSDVVAMLDTQYRMHPDIGELVSAMFYSGRLHHAADATRVGDIAARAPYPGRALVIVDTSGLTRCENRPGGYSRINSHSAAICERLVLAALADGITSIALITPYADQAREIRARLTRLGGAPAHVECNTVHRFQGHERDMIIFDAVDAAPLRPGILLSGQAPTSQATHLLNVTLSRARGKLLLVADLDYFRTLAPQSLMNRISTACIREMPPPA